MNKRIEAAWIYKDHEKVQAIICGKEYKHKITFKTMIEATTFFDEILNYNEWVYTDFTKNMWQKESADT